MVSPDAVADAMLPDLNPDPYLTLSLTSEAGSQGEAELSALVQGKGKIDSACPVYVVRLTHHVLYIIPCGIFVLTCSCNGSFNFVEIRYWTTDDATMLYQLRSEQEESFTSGKVAHTTLWTKIALNLSILTEREKSSANCKNKWKALKKEWRKTLDHNKISGNERRSCPLYNEFQELYGGRACEQPSVIVDSLREGREFSCVPPAATITTVTKAENTGTLAESTATPLGDSPRSRIRRAEKNPSPLLIVQACQDEIQKRWKRLDEETKERAERQHAQHNEKMSLLAEFIDVLKNQKS